MTSNLMDITGSLLKVHAKGWMVLESLEPAKDILYAKTTNAQSILLNKFVTPLTSRGTSRATHADHMDSMHTEFCGCVKVTEYDKENNILTVYHQGTHSCTPKPDIQQHVEKAKEANFDNAPLNNAL